MAWQVSGRQEFLSLVFYFFFFSIEVCLRFFLISFKKKLFCMSSAASVGEAGLCLFSLFLCLVSLFVHLFLYHIFTDLFPEKKCSVWVARQVSGRRGTRLRPVVEFPQCRVEADDILQFFFFKKKTWWVFIIFLLLGGGRPYFGFSFRCFFIYFLR